MLQKLAEDRKLLKKVVYATTAKISAMNLTRSELHLLLQFLQYNPFFCRAKAVFLPNPRLDPVTSAIFALSCVIALSFQFCVSVLVGRLLLKLLFERYCQLNRRYSKLSITIPQSSGSLNLRSSF